MYRAMMEMKRRQFIMVLGGMGAWPVAARAQRENMRRIGELMTVAADDPEGQARHTAFAQGLQQWGWLVGRNVQIDIRWGATTPDRARRNATELVALAPDVIFATGSVAVGPLLEATRSIPIVFVLVPDPVAAGFVESLAHPGGNSTGFINFEYGISAKWPELLKELSPGVKRVVSFAIPPSRSAQASSARCSPWRRGLALS
jgi:putative ABC transport system substrate-binding protein